MKKRCTMNGTLVRISVGKVAETQASQCVDRRMKWRETCLDDV